MFECFGNENSELAKNCRAYVVTVVSKAVQTAWLAKGAIFEEKKTLQTVQKPVRLYQALNQPHLVVLSSINNGALLKTSCRKHMFCYKPQTFVETRSGWSQLVQNIGGTRYVLVFPFSEVRRGARHFVVTVSARKSWNIGKTHCKLSRASTFLTRTFPTR